MNGFLSGLTQQAIAIALQAHNQQPRKGGKVPIPYICHPLEIVSRLMKAVGNDEIILAAAALHDVVEDTNWNALDLAQAMPEKVVRIVVQLSDGDYQDRVKPPKLERKKQYIENLRNAPQDIRDAVLLISAVDKLASGEDYIADAETRPLSPEDAALNLWFYRELMPLYLEVLTPYPRLFNEMVRCWEQLCIIWSPIKVS